MTILSIGTPVIVNDVDRPCGQSIAIISEYKDELYKCEYLCDVPLLNKYICRQKNPTPIEDFGVGIHLLKYEKMRLYILHKISEQSKAVYPDGRIREWQNSFDFQNIFEAQIIPWNLVFEWHNKFGKRLKFDFTIKTLADGEH